VPPLAVMDLHCHVDLYPDPQGIVSESEALGIRTIAVTNAPSVFHFTRGATDRCRYVRPAAGLHPELVRTHAHELPLLWPLLRETRYVGEVGLDYLTSDRQERGRQREVFAAILDRCAQLGGKVLSVHSRRAVDDVIAAIDPAFPGKVILHWFSGTTRQLQTAVDRGCYFSVNTPMVTSLRKPSVVAAIPRDRVLLETDGPFVKVGGRAAKPVDAARTADALGVLWALAPATVRQVLVENLGRLLA
jgi:TatD DNase family protein